MKEYLFKLIGIDAFDGTSVSNWQINFANMKTNFQRLIFVLLSLALGFGIWWIYTREPDYCSTAKKRVMAACRMAGVFILLLIVANPVLAVFVKGSAKGKVIVLVDDSNSMSRVDKFKKSEDKVIAAHALGKLPLNVSDATRLAVDVEKSVTSTSRIDIARGMLKNKDIALLEKLQEKFAIEAWSFSKGNEAEMRRLGSDMPVLTAAAFDDLKTEGSVTEMGNALRATLKRYKGQPLSGIVLLTDGGSNKGEDPVTVAGESPVRIFPVGIGVPESQDVALAHVFMENKVFVDDLAPITVRIKQHGYNNEPAKLTVTSDGTEIASMNVILKETGEQAETIRIKPKIAGRFTYKIEIQPDRNASEDIEPSNNSKLREVEVIDQKINVLMVETDPRWEYRYLKNSLGRDKRVNLKVLLRGPDMAELAKPGSNYLKEFPTREELFKFHVIVFGNMSATDGFFTEHDIDNLRRFVLDEGGGMWFIAGKNNMPDTFRDSPLSVLLPVELDANSPPVTAEDEQNNPMTDPYRLVLTSEGRTHSLTRLEMSNAENSEETNAALWDAVPEMYWYHKAIRPKLGAAALIVQGFGKSGPASRRDSPTPLLVTSQVGRGHVLYQGFADLWRMRFPTELGPDALERFHGHVVQYLGMPKLLGRTARTEITTDREEYFAGDRIRINARVLEKGTLDYSKAEKLAAVFTNLADETSKVDFELTPEPGARGIFRAEVPANAIGRFRITLRDDVEDGAHTDFSVQIPQIEMENPDMRKDLLENIAKASAVSTKTAVDEKNPVRMYLADQAGELVKDIQEAQKDVPPVRRESPLWSSPLLLLLFTLFMGTEWLLRKRSDLL
ncbi:MAG: hypothetical protein WCT04_26565 [Planctomycetota bacterium]